MDRFLSSVESEQFVKKQRFNLSLQQTRNRLLTLLYILRSSYSQDESFSEYQEPIVHFKSGSG